MKVLSMHPLRSASAAAGWLALLVGVAGCAGGSGDDESSSALGRSESPLSLSLHDAADDVWTPLERVDISYCVSTDFGAYYPRAVQEMLEATRDWEAAAYVKFIYESEHDNHCAYPDAPVVFTVQSIFLGTGEAGAESFPPSYVHEGEFHWLGIALPAYDTLDRSVDRRTSRGAFAHELGHILGFRHEHVRPEASQPPYDYDCFDEPVSDGYAPWRLIPGASQYDSNSVMHYVTAGCGPLEDFALTDTDRAAAHAVYPSPRRCEVWAGAVQLAATDVSAPTSASDGESSCEAFAIDEQRHSGLILSTLERRPDHFRAAMIEAEPMIEDDERRGFRPEPSRDQGRWGESAPRRKRGRR